MTLVARARGQMRGLLPRLYVGLHGCELGGIGRAVELRMTTQLFGVPSVY
jgi:hypothetical protein